MNEEMKAKLGTIKRNMQTRNLSSQERIEVNYLFYCIEVLAGKVEAFQLSYSMFNEALNSWGEKYNNSEDFPTLPPVEEDKA